MRCPHCSFDNSDDAAFCEKCGHVFLSSDRVPQVPDPAELERRREAALTDVPPIVQVPDITPPETTGVIRKTPVVPEVVPAATGPLERVSVAYLADPLPEPPREPDFSGFERLVDSSYVPPAAPAAGDTAEIPVIHDEYVPRPRNYTLGLSPREQRKRDREQRRLEKKFAKTQRKEEERAAKEAAKAEREAARAAEAAEQEARAAAALEAARAAEAALAREQAASQEPAAAPLTDGVSASAEASGAIAAPAVSEAALELPAADDAPAVADGGETADDSAEAAATMALPAADLDTVLMTGDGVVSLFERTRKRRGAHGATANAPTEKAARELPGAETGLAVAGERAIESTRETPDATGSLALSDPTETGAPALAVPEDGAAADLAASAPAAADRAARPAEKTGEAPKAAVPEDAGAPSRQAPDPKAAREAARKKRAAEKAARTAEKRAAKAARAAEKSASRSGRRKAPLIIAVAVALIAAAGLLAGGTYMAEIWGGKTIPSVEGLSQNEAIATLGEKGFGAEVVTVKSDEPAGTVLAATPGSGQRAEEGTTITLEVATPRVIPDIKGLTRQEAADALAAEGFTAVEYAEKKSNKDEDTVLKVSPKAGTEAVSTEPVTVTVAIPFVVPEVEGKSRDEAVAALEDEGYEVKTQQYYTEDVEEGTAVGTDPEAGTKLASGSEVTLLVARSRGNELRELTVSILPGAVLKNSDGSYKVEEVKSTSYRGDGEVSYKVVARKFEVVDLPFNLGQKTYYDKQTTELEGGIVWSDDNKVSYANPSITY